MPSRHIRCMITASLRATATFAFLSELRLASVMPQCLSAVHWVDRLSITLAAAKSAVRVNSSPVLAMRPRRSVSPDWNWRGASPRWAPTLADRRNRSGRSIVALKASAVTGPGFHAQRQMRAFGNQFAHAWGEGASTDDQS